MKEKHLIEVWKKTIDVQQHFNDIELKIRNFAITLIVGVLGVVAYTIKENMELTLAGRTFPFGAVVLAVSLVGWFGFYFMDRFWYHRLLMGSVLHALELEKNHPELQLTTKIGEQSPIKVFGKWDLHSTRKIDILYCGGFVVLIASSLLLFAAG